MKSPPCPTCGDLDQIKRELRQAAQRAKDAANYRKAGIEVPSSLEALEAPLRTG